MYLFDKEVIVDNVLNYTVFIEDPVDCCFVDVENVNLREPVEVVQVVFDGGVYRVSTIIQRGGVSHAGCVIVKNCEVEAYLVEDYCENFEPVNLRLSLSSYEQVRQVPVNVVELIARFCFQ